MIIEIDGLGADGKYLDWREKVNYLSAITEKTVESNNKGVLLAWLSFYAASKRRIQSGGVLLSWVSTARPAFVTRQVLIQFKCFRIGW